ncbi:MAG: ATP-dependent Clp protease adaptor ClpS [Planctomycetota bacterium]|nr:ATP-dependent Clp protease adaptor ClpS [Planctomycetota bacterium]MCX8039625.1 ATP-dependent Clp protease adaptor ClpS [Planctomycetota bacterium]MDW8373080.1 ATP-dependent Clp protease adaptor ClpS [Planctomycetota bacterium]
MPDPLALPVSESDTALDRGWRIVLFNDDVTPIDVVIHGLQRACGLSEEVAEMVALEAHHEGSAVVRRALTQAEAERQCGQLTAFTRIPRLCPGVRCRAERDE